MANKVRGTVDFEADGEIYTLKLSTNAICEIESQSGKGINEFAGGLNDPVLYRVSSLRIIMFACLRAGKSDVENVDEAGDLIDVIGTEKSWGKISEAFSLAFPEVGDKQGKPKAAR